MIAKPERSSDTMNLPYETVQDAVAKLRVRHFPGLHPLPYNRFETERSQHWWLSPTSERAAFRYGKAIFTTNEAWGGAGDVFCGFNVEKGVLHKGDWYESNIMTEDWFWHRFLDLANAPVFSAAEEAADAIGTKLQLCVDCGTLVSSKWDMLMFDIDGTQLLQRAYQPIENTLDGMKGVTNFAEFADALRALDGTPTAWHWIDVLVGTWFTRDASGPDDTDKCAALLKPFQSWIRAAA
ncbi:MAG: hypothetical protein ABI614_15530 [Planctomycetota bacterium]